MPVDPVLSQAYRTAKALDVSDGGRDYLAISDTAAHYPVGAQPNRVCRVINGGAGTAQTNALNIYDSATPESPQAGELIWSGILGSSITAAGIVNLQIPLKQTLVAKMAGAVTASTVVLVTWV